MAHLQAQQREIVTATLKIKIKGLDKEIDEMNIKTEVSSDGEEGRWRISAYWAEKLQLFSKNTLYFCIFVKSIVFRTDCLLTYSMLY